MNTDDDAGTSSRVKPSFWKLLVKIFSVPFRISCFCLGDLETDTVSCTIGGLSPSLWCELPEELVVIIVDKFLKALPLLELLEYRILSKTWNAHILSSFGSRQFDHDPKCVFAIQQDRLLLVYDYKTSIWHETPLIFPSVASFEPDQCKSSRAASSLRLVTSDEGLLCFSTEVFGHFLLCNPITRCWKELNLPLEITEADHISVLQNHRNGSLSLVGLVHNHQTGAGEFQLLVVTGPWLHADGGLTSMKTMIYKSLTGSWEPGPPVPVAAHLRNICGERLWHLCASVTCNGQVYCLIRYLNVHSELLKYDMEAGSWSNIQLRSQRNVWHNLQLLQHRRAILLVESNYRWMYDFYELKESQSGRIAWIKVMPILTVQVDKYIRSLGGSYRSNYLKCVGFGNVIYFLGRKKLESGSYEWRVVLYRRAPPGSSEWMFTEAWPIKSASHSAFSIDELPCFAFEPSLHTVHT